MKIVFFVVFMLIISTPAVYSQENINLLGYTVTIDSKGNFKALDNDGDIWYSGIYDTKNKEIKSAKVERYSQEIDIDNISEWSIIDVNRWALNGCKMSFNKDKSSLGVNCPYAFNLTKKEQIAWLSNDLGISSPAFRGEIKRYNDEIYSFAFSVAPKSTVFWKADAAKCGIAEDSPSAGTLLKSLFTATEDDLCRSVQYTFLYVEKL